MALTIDVVPKRAPVASYPKLMHDADAGLILLMSCDSSGVVLRPGTTRYSVGHHSTNWMMHRLTDYYGKLSLENV